MSNDRRDFLKAFGVGVPAVLATTTTALSRGQAAEAREIFEVYVSECLKALPLQYTRDKGTVVREMIEAHGTAIAMLMTKRGRGL